MSMKCQFGYHEWNTIGDSIKVCRKCDEQQELRIVHNPNGKHSCQWTKMPHVKLDSAYLSARELWSEGLLAESCIEADITDKTKVDTYETTRHETLQKVAEVLRKHRS